MNYESQEEFENYECGEETSIGEIDTNSQDSKHSQDEKTLNKLMKEFDEQFNNTQSVNLDIEIYNTKTRKISVYRDRLKDFIAQAITKAQESAREDVKNKFLTDKSIQHTLKLVPSSQRELFISEIIEKL